MIFFVLSRHHNGTNGFIYLLSFVMCYYIHANQYHWLLKTIKNQCNMTYYNCWLLFFFLDALILHYGWQSYLFLTGNVWLFIYFGKQSTILQYKFCFLGFIKKHLCNLSFVMLFKSTSLLNTCNTSTVLRSRKFF